MKKTKPAMPIQAMASGFSPAASAPLAHGWPNAGPVQANPDGTTSQTLATVPMAGIPGLAPGVVPAGGQTIQVNMNAANPNLSFKEWAARGFVGGVGRFFAFPFVLVGEILSALGRGLAKLMVWATMLVLGPTLAMSGCHLMHSVEHAPTAQAGSTSVMQQVGGAFSGIGAGLRSSVAPSMDDIRNSGANPELIAKYEREHGEGAAKREHHAKED